MNMGNKAVAVAWHMYEPALFCRPVRQVHVPLSTHLAGEWAAVCPALVYCCKPVQQVDPWHTHMAEANGTIVNTIQANLMQQGTAVAGFKLQYCSLRPTATLCMDIYSQQTL